MWYSWSKKISADLYNRICKYKTCEDYGFTQKELKYQNLEKIDELEKITLKEAYDSIKTKKPNEMLKFIKRKFLIG